MMTVGSITAGEMCTQEEAAIIVDIDVSGG